ncbi:type VI secretion system baseplate subunit TssG [Salmonella enterica subsp. enterica]|nr:type VI secretion system baseplate subunit TssG [Salmonella enterica subsp. enterica]
MAGADRAVIMALNILLSRFSFFQQIREMLKKFSQARTKEEKVTWLEEHVVLQSDLSLDATKGAFSSAVFLKESSQWQLSVCAGGLTGASGALPLVYTEWLMERVYRYNDHAGIAFLNIFSHRLYCLRYLSWAHTRAYAECELTSGRPSERILQALWGDGNEPECGTDGGRYFIPATRSLRSLAQWLTRIAGADVSIVPFQVRWQPVSEAERCRTGTGSLTLGEGAVIGQYIQERQTCFSLTLGPVPAGHALSFYPGQERFKKLQASLSLFLGRGNGLYFYFTLRQYTDTADGRVSSGCLGNTLIVGQRNPGIRTEQSLSFPLDYRADIS